MAQVRTNTARMNDFEAMASYLLPYCPVSKKRISNTKRGVTDISYTTGDLISVAVSKVATGKRGVEYQFYERPEYNTFTE